MQILERAKNREFRIDDLIYLNTINFDDLQTDPTEGAVKLTDLEAQAVRAYKEYEKASQEQRKKATGEQSSKK